MLALAHFQPEDRKGIEEAIRRDGACVVENFIDQALCNDLLKDFSKDLDGMEWGLDELGYKNEFYGSQTKRLHGLFSKSSHMETVLTHPLMLELAKSFLTGNKRATDIRLSNTELMVLNQHQAAQEFHTDGGSWYRVQQAEKPEEILLSANIALTDFTATNGATRVVPGSHLWASDRQPTESEVCQAIMPKGSSLLYSGNVIHSGGANEDAMIRIGLYLGYIVSWLRPIENQLVTNDPKDIFALSNTAQKLLDVSPGGFTVIA